ncbi:MAG: hypothetical protein C5B52_04200 [Bacteroidetes bacterium]|nr:MAG: hypothetical protein C5B52_04200 [Bacteroidota bacterium]
MDNHESLWILLTKMMDEELTPDEATSLERMMQQWPQFSNIIQKLKELFRSCRENDEADTLKAYVQLWRKITSRRKFLNTSNKYSLYSFSKN